MPELALFWFRRDLRLNDNHGLFKALSGNRTVLPVFIFDTDILDHLEDPTDARVNFLHAQLTRIDQHLRQNGSGLLVHHGKPLEVIRHLVSKFDIKAVYTNHDYEPYAIKRDQAIADLLKDQNINFHHFKDQVQFEKDQILTDGHLPYKVFTPYSRRWKKLLDEKSIDHFASEALLGNFYQGTIEPMPSLGKIGFRPSSIIIPPSELDTQVIGQYDQRRDFPAIKGTSRLGIHLRHGTISIREAIASALKWNETFLNELIWREFYMQILYHFPKVVDKSFKPQYDYIPWRNDLADFQRWCKGTTGYPMVDAGMRELNETGFMHNRSRMITASFLTKHLLIDWRWGEAYFASKLLDYELSSNNGGWQWAAGTGTDAQPYFRVFNPQSQQQKFDPKGAYIQKWIPELSTFDYPQPMVDHKMARERAINTFKEVLQST